MFVVSKQEYMAQFGVKESFPPATLLKEISSSDAISKKREELELKRLELEISKLSSPDTRVDYFEKMLELQKNSFTQQLDMQKQQLDLRLEIEKLKLMGDGESESMLPYLQMLAPLIPAILKKESGTKKETAVNSAVPQTQTKQEEEKMKVPTTAGEIEEYKQAIKRGEISFEEAYEDFLETPFASSMSKEQFRVKFNELKKSI